MKLSETFVLACGEFGRTPGPLSNTRLGRDHCQRMFYVFAGGGVQGGMVIGAANNTGRRGPALWGACPDPTANKGRVKGEIHARFGERPRVRFPRATRPYRVS